MGKNGFPPIILRLALGEVCTRFWWGNQRGRGHWGDQDVDGRIRWIFRKWEGVVGTGWTWLRIWTGGRRL